MHRNFDIHLGIRLLQPPYDLDLHNFFDFQTLHYSVADRTLLLQWRRSTRDGIPPSTPAALAIEFQGVSEFRFQPRDSEVPFTEDDCLSTFGYFTDEPWAQGSVIVTSQSQTPDPKWLTALDFMSGALLAVQADSAHATITP